MTHKEQFEQARRLYPKKTGKRGLELEWEAFTKLLKYRGHYDEIMPLLVPAIERQIVYRASTKEWCPQWKDFCRWMKGGWWTEEVPQTDAPKRHKCDLCGELSTRSVIGYYPDGARNVRLCDKCPDPENVR